jgi:hypothetical protein
LVVHLVVTDRPGFAGKTTMLTYIQINAAKPRGKEYALSDSQCLYLTIRPNGSKLWRFKYRFLDKQKTLHLGGWPTVSLAAERNGKTDPMLGCNSRRVVRSDHFILTGSPATTS